MAQDHSEQILSSLRAVDALRQQHAGDPGLGARLLAIKTYQGQRFARTYADLLMHPRYGGAARFFLDELYGPREFTERDAQFARIVPGLARLVPDELLATLAQLGELHALSETLDDAMARQLAGLPVDAPAYVQAWQAVGEPAQRERQIAMTLQIGRALDRYTRKRVLRTTLHLMRRPANLAGLGAMQRFLESGFDAFGAMKGADEFLACVGDRERALAAALFALQATDRMTARASLVSLPITDPLVQLP